MSVVQSTQAPAEPTAPPRADRRRGRGTDLLTAVLALALAGWVTGGLWLDPNHRAIKVNSGDQALFEWLLAYGAHGLTHPQNPFFTHLLNVPDGVNLAVNTAITVYAYVFAPLTLLIGPPATFLLILTLNLAATAYAWYWLFSRHLVRSRPAAALAGLFCGFAPGLISHANAHLNWTAQWLVPLVVWRVLRLGRSRRIWRDGAVLGVAVAVMFSLAAEALLFTALACLIFLGCWALSRRAAAAAALPTFLRGLAVTGLAALVLLAYPLWMHFFGPQRYQGTGFDPLVHSEDLAAYGAFPARSLAGVAGLDSGLAPNPTEENSFFGVPLLVLAIACFVQLWRNADRARRAVLRALAVTAAVFAVLSLGPRLKWDGQVTDVWLPYALLGRLPVLDAALPARLALVVIPIIAALLAFTLDQISRPGNFFRTRKARSPDQGRGFVLKKAPARPDRTASVYLGWMAAFAVALLPLVPAPLLTVHLPAVPRFITEGTWRDHVSPGGVLAPVPLTSDQLPDGQRWQAYALAHRQGEFAIPAGFFLGPGGPHGRGRIGPVPRPTAALLAEVAQTGVVPVITDADRRQAAADLRYWRVDVVVLADQVHGAKFAVHRDAVLRATTGLLGPGQRVADVTLWQIHPS